MGREKGYSVAATQRAGVGYLVASGPRSGPERAARGDGLRRSLKPSARGIAARIRYARRAMRFVYVMDPMERVLSDKDTTFAFQRAAQRRGHVGLHCEPRDVYVEGGDVWARVREVRVSDTAPHFALRRTARRAPGRRRVRLHPQGPPVRRRSTSISR